MVWADNPGHVFIVENKELRKPSEQQQENKKPRLNSASKQNSSLPNSTHDASDSNQSNRNVNNISKKINQAQSALDQNVIHKRLTQ